MRLILSHRNNGSRMRKKLLIAFIAILTVCLPAATALADAFKPSTATPSQTLMATALVFISGVIFLIVCALLFLRVSHDTAEEDVRIWPTLLFVVVLAVVLRAIAATVFTGYSSDIACFKGWAIAAYENGTATFYTTGMFADYPPGYMAVLWVLGFIRSAFNIEAGGALFTLIIKMPSILAEVGMAILAYRVASKRLGRTFGLLCASFLLFNPAFFFNSSVWGQIDAVLTLFIALTLWFLINEQYIPAAAMFALAVIFKPQAIMFAPVVGLAYVYALFKKGGLLKAFIGIIGGLVAAAAVFAVFIWPFTGNQPVTWIIDKYASTIGYYNYASINAFNVYTLLGLNWGVIPSFTLLGYEIPYGLVAAGADLRRGRDIAVAHPWAAAALRSGGVPCDLRVHADAQHARALHAPRLRLPAVRLRLFARCVYAVFCGVVLDICAAEPNAGAVRRNAGDARNADVCAVRRWRRAVRRVRGDHGAQAMEQKGAHQDPRDAGLDLTAWLRL